MLTFQIIKDNRALLSLLLFLSAATTLFLSFNINFIFKCFNYVFVLFLFLLLISHFLMICCFIIFIVYLKIRIIYVFILLSLFIFGLIKLFKCISTSISINCFFLYFSWLYLGIGIILSFFLIF